MGLLEESLAQAEVFAGKAYELCKYGKYRDALEFYRQASDLDPTNYKYWYNAAVACDRINDLVGMERASRKTIECDGLFIKGYVRLAKALVRQEKYEEASEIIEIGLYFDRSQELLDLKAAVGKSQEERSLIEARRLEEQLRKSGGSTRSVTSNTSRASAASTPASPSAATAVAAHNRHQPTSSGWKPAPESPRSSATPASPSPQKPNLVVNHPSPDNNNKRRPAAAGGIPPNQREIPRLNNPHFGDSSSTSTPRPPKLAQPTRPAVPPNRENGPDYKDQCGTFIVAPTAVKPYDQKQEAPAPNNNNKKKPSGLGFLRRKNDADGRKNGEGRNLEL